MTMSAARRTIRPIDNVAHAGPDVILPGHAAYDDARRPWNLAVDQRPAAIAVARTAADVVDAVALAAERGLRVAAQGTGHLAGALPDLDDALLLKTAIGGVEVDPAARVARVGAGAVWSEVVEAVHPHGLAALSGSSRDVGVLGYTLGGGAGCLGRSKGLAANNVRAIELVSADGRFVRTDAERLPALFWALRGGGGNFGVVTHVELQLFPIAEVFAGMTVWPARDAREVLAAWAQWAPAAPDEVTTAVRLMRLPDLPEVPEPMRDVPVVAVDGAVLAEPDRATTLLAGFRAVGGPLMDTWSMIPPRRLIEVSIDPPAPVPADGDSLLLRELDAAALDAFIAAVDPGEVAPLLFAQLRQLGGALGRVPEGAGARACLEGAFALFAVGVPHGAEHADLLAARIDRVTDAMRPWSTGTVYLNFADRGGSAERAYGPGVYERLQAVRRVWDREERFVASHRIATRGLG
jgi:hypothetical protein